MGEVHYTLEDLKELQSYIDCKEFEELLKERYKGVSILCPRCWLELSQQDNEHLYCPQQDNEYLYCPICGERING